MVEGLAVGLTRRKSIRWAVLGGVYGGAAVSVSWWAGVVRLRVPTPGLPSQAQVWAAARRRGGGSHTGTPPSLDFVRSA
eukprot:COSAG02_NODE_3775_length_6252_cov_3.764505_11_plen_78_part_01